MTDFAQPPPPPRKGLGPLAWIAIGCGGLILVVGMVMVAGGLFVAKKVKDVAADFEANPAQAAAELVVRAHPDLELVSSDPDHGKLTVRNKTTGEEATFDIADIQNGNFSFETPEGKVDINASGVTTGEGMKISSSQGDVQLGGTAATPDWVPLYPGASASQSVFSAVTQEGTNGILALSTADSPEAVVEFYETKLKELGFAVQVTRFSSGSAQSAGVVATASEPNRNLNVGVVREADTTQISLNYNQAK